MSASEKQSLSTVPESLPQAKVCRKAPLPHFAVKPPIAEQAGLLWHEAIQALLVAGKVPLRPNTLAASRDSGKQEGGGGEQTAGPDVIQLAGRLQALIMENEVAAELAVQAVAQLSWEQLQTVQVVLDKMGFELLSDFLHIVTYNTSDPFAKSPLGGASAADAQPGGHRSDDRQGARSAGLDKDQKQAHDELAEPAPPILQHVWKADLWREQQLRRPAATPDMAKYAQILAGKHWHTQPASEAEAAGTASGSAGMRASVSGPHHNAWQRASIVAGAHRASVLQRFGAPRQSIVAVLPATPSPDPPPSQTTPASTSGVHHHSYTGLSYAAWHPLPNSNTIVEATAIRAVPGASLQTRRRFSAAFDGSPGGALATPLAAPAAPTLDAVFLAKGPGLHQTKGAQQVIHSGVQQAKQEVAAVELKSSNAEHGTAS